MLASCALAAVITAAIWQSGRDQATVGGFVAFITALLQLIAPIKHLVGGRGADHPRPGRDRARRRPHRRTRRPETGGSYDPGRAAGPDRAARRQPRLPRRRRRRRSTASRLTIEPGESVALVGPSGAGKSTLVNLLPRFLEPTSGVVTLDGVPLGEWNVAALRRQIALVSQDVSLFNDSVAANVALGASVDRERVREALARRQPARLRRRPAAGHRHASSATTPASSRAGSASAWRSPGRSTATRRS